MKRPYQITGLVFILVAAFVMRESTRMEFYTSLGPGPGFFPFWLSLALGVVAAGIVLQATFGPSDPMPADFLATRSGYLRIGAIAAALAGSVVLMNPMGFRLTMLGFLLFLLFALGRQNPIVTGLVSLAGSFGTYHVFVEWLQVPLPVGMFGM